uniref:Venom protein n=1 Tax=Hadrurus spadix TaxID=141984 RepID=A0A1W7R997_9SCOR
MKPFVCAFALLVVSMLFYDEVHSASLTEKHWEFICSRPRPKLKKLLNCYLAKENEEMLEKYKRLEACMNKPLIMIVEEFCRRDTTLSQKEREHLELCFSVDFNDDEPEPNERISPMVECIERDSEYKKIRI